MRWTAKDAKFAGYVETLNPAQGYRNERRRVYVALRPLTCGNCGGVIAIGEDFSPVKLGHPGCVRCFAWIKGKDGF